MSPSYIQHNPNVPSGLEGFRQYFTAVHRRFRLSVNIVNIIAEGDMVVIHVEQNVRSRFFNLRVVAMDRFRIENGKIAEHWDVMSGESFLDRVMLELSA